jgi:hypothetical protein
MERREFARRLDPDHLFSDEDPDSDDSEDEPDECLCEGANVDNRVSESSLAPTRSPWCRNDVQAEEIGIYTRAACDAVLKPRDLPVPDEPAPLIVRVRHASP